MGLKENIESVLARITEPDSGAGLISAKIAEVAADGEITLRFSYPAKTAAAELERQIGARLGEAGLPARVRVLAEVVARAPQSGARRLPQVKNIIAVGSAKGGVGKSAVAANTALSLAAEGARVGILDADIYGPSVPTMLGVCRRPQGGKGGGILPLEAHGLQVMSLGFLTEKGAPAVWRGPMASRALVQLLEETRWDNLDYLILDMPPGTGDIQLTAAQKTPLTGAVVVTTPQEIALADAQKGLAMFRKAGVHILGAVENMSFYECPQCGGKSHLFGEGGGKKLCEENGVRFLGGLPLHISIREDADGGTPTAVKTPDGEIAAAFRKIARLAAAEAAKRPRDFSAVIPPVVAEK